VPPALASIGLALYGVGVVALLSTGRIDLRIAITFAAAPVVLAVAILRPEWILLGVVLIPPSVMTQVPAMQMVVVLGIVLFGFLLNGRVYVGLKTGIYPLVGIIALALFMKADVPDDAAIAADAMLKHLLYYCLLMLAAYQATANGRLQVDSFVDALLVGVLVAVVLQPFVSADTTFDQFTQTPYQGQFAYLAAMGFGVSYVRFSLSPPSERRGIDAFAMLVLFVAIVLGWTRIMWVAALAVFALVSRWTHRKAFWIALAVVLLIALTLPLVGERILPGGSANIANSDTLDRITTGRSALWQDLLGRGADAAPWGNGWGYIWSVTPVDIFGFEGAFTAGGNPFVFAHNDFIFLFVELGILGVALLALFWIQLFHKVRRVSRQGASSVLFDVRVLIPILVVGLLVQLFDNSFAIRPVAERLFIASGLILGRIAASERRSVSASSMALMSPGTR